MHLGDNLIDHCSMAHLTYPAARTLATLMPMVDRWFAPPRGVLPGLISIAQDGDQRVLCLSGEIDAAVVQAFDELNGAQPVAVDAIDAAAVSFMAAAGVGLMLRCRRESAAQGRPALLRQSAPPVDRVPQLTGTSSHLRQVTGDASARGRPHGF